MVRQPFFARNTNFFITTNLSLISESSGFVFHFEERIDREIDAVLNLKNIPINGVAFYIKFY